MIKKIVLPILFFLTLITKIYAASQIILPANKIIYHCTCKTPNSKGVCSMYVNGKKKILNPALPQSLELKSGWIVQPDNCHQGMTYTLTRGSVMFSGKKILALYTVPKFPLQDTGYVYHAKPSLPFTKQYYSLLSITNPAIRGIDIISKNNGWQCDHESSPASCHSKFTGARCFVGSQCHFIYD